MERQRPCRGLLLDCCDERNSQRYRIKLWNSTCYFHLILTLIFGINFTEGMTWITKPSPIYKCTGQNANLTWEYNNESSKEITRLQWRFNGTDLIAYSSVRQGFNVAPKYQGRVVQSGETGIVLRNISSEDIGNYTFHPLIVWEENPNIQSVWLNVIEPTMETECRCANLQISPEWRNGQMFHVVAEGCKLEINSSFCCPKGLAIEYCESDPQKLCVRISHIWHPFNQIERATQITNSSNLMESTTQSRIVTQQTATTENTERDHMPIDLHANNLIIIFILVTNSLCLMCVLWICWWTIRGVHFRKMRGGKDVSGEMTLESKTLLQSISEGIRNQGTSEEVSNV